MDRPLEKRITGDASAHVHVWHCHLDFHTLQGKGMAFLTFKFSEGACYSSSALAPHPGSPYKLLFLAPG